MHSPLPKMAVCNAIKEEMQRKENIKEYKRRHVEFWLQGSGNASCASSQDKGRRTLSHFGFKLNAGLEMAKLRNFELALEEFAHYEFGKKLMLT